MCRAEDFQRDVDTALFQATMVAEKGISGVWILAQALVFCAYKYLGNGDLLTLPYQL